MRACLSIVLHANSSFSLVLWLWAGWVDWDGTQNKGCVMAGPREEEEEEEDEEEKGNGFSGL